jgi:hypothetical protein
MIYKRSGTQMDANSAFFPQNFLNGMRGRVSRLGRLGLGDDLADWGANPADTGPLYPTDLDFGGDAGIPSAQGFGDAPPIGATTPGGGVPALPSPTMQPGGGGFWNSLMDKAPTLLKDMALAAKTGDIQSKLLDVNIQRARQGLPPLDASAYSPSMNVGVAPATMKKLQQGGVMVGLGFAALAALLIGSRRSARRR